MAKKKDTFAGAQPSLRDLIGDIYIKSKLERASLPRSKEIQDKVKYLGGVELNNQERLVIITLAILNGGDETLNIADLHQRYLRKISLGSLSAAISRLVAYKFIEKKVPLNGKNGYTLILRPKGFQKYNEIRDSVSSVFEPIIPNTFEIDCSENGKILRECFNKIIECLDKKLKYEL